MIKPSNEIFPEPTKYPPIEFSATQRPQPESAEHAIATLKKIGTLYDSSNVPGALDRDLTNESAYQHAKAIKLIQLQMPQDVEWLKNLNGSKVPGADQFTTQQIDNAKTTALSRLEKFLPSEIEHSTKYTRQFIEDSIAPQMWQHLEKAADVDMSDSNLVKNKFGNELTNQSLAQQINRLSEAFAAAVTFDEFMGTDSGYVEKKNDFRKMIARYRTKLEKAADAIQPPIDIGDANLLKIAQGVLADQKIKSERVIVNAAKKSYSKDHYTVDFGERSIEKSPYRWEEFQVATIEKEGDAYYLWYNTMLFYSNGPSTVPTQKWALGPRHKSAPISKKNINN